MVKMYDKENRKFWLNYFYIKSEDVVANADGFPEVWNYARKYLPLSFSFFFVLCVTSNFHYVDISSLFCVDEAAHPPLVEDIYGWVSQVLPYTARIHEWTTLLKRFGHAHPMASEFVCFEFLLFCEDRSLNLSFLFFFLIPGILEMAEGSYSCIPPEKHYN